MNPEARVTYTAYTPSTIKAIPTPIVTTINSRNNQETTTDFVVIHVGEIDIVTAMATAIEIDHVQP